MKIFKHLVLTCAVMAGFGFVALSADNVAAINVFPQCQTGASSTSVCKAATTDNATSMAKTIINTLLFVLGIIAVIMIIVGGIRYTTSAGDSSRIKGAKDTLMYSVVGLVVALLAFAIVNFVLGRFI